MLGSILRLAMMAGTGAGMAAGLRQTMLKLGALLALAMVFALVVFAAIGAFGVAVYFALVPELGPVGAAAAAGGLLLVLAGTLALFARLIYRRRRSTAASAAGLGAGIGGPLGAAALGASMSGAGFNFRGILERNAMTVLLTAFIAGMVMNNRR